MTEEWTEIVSFAEAVVNPDSVERILWERLMERGIREADLDPTTDIRISRSDAPGPGRFGSPTYAALVRTERLRGAR